MSYPHLPFRDCTRSTHPPFYRRWVCKDFNAPYRSCHRSPRFACICE
nr:MAG TPA: hypothetical protein [Caudoviricetes sp.]